MVTTAFRNIYEFRFKCKGEMFEEHITMEELVRYISSRFAPEELDTLIGMLSSIGLSLESTVCRGDVIRDNSRGKGQNKYICTSCGNSYRTKPKYCTFTILRRIPVELLTDIVKVQQEHKVFKCEVCKQPNNVTECPVDHNQCLRVKKPNKATGSKFGYGCNTIEELHEYLDKHPELREK